MRYLRPVLAVLAGLFIGMFVNMTLVNMGPKVIPPPPGGDITTMEGLKSTIHLFEAKHFLFPFLAHALGTFTGALVAALIDRRNKLLVAMIIAGLNLGGGAMMVYQLPSPMWFALLDLLVAYVPMGLLAVKLVKPAGKAAEV